VTTEGELVKQKM